MAEVGLLSTMFPVMRAELGLAAADLGVLIAAERLTAAAMSPLWVGLAGRWSRKGVVVMAACLAGTVTVAIGLVGGFTSLLVLSCVLAAISGGLVPVTTAILADLFQDRHRGRAVGIMYASISLIRALLATLLSQLSATTQGWRGGLIEPLTRFIGRDKERRALSLLLQANRLVTLTGLGGVGKTRLVMRLQREIASAYADGVALVDLAPLAAAQVDEAVAAAVGAGGGEVAAELALVTALRGREQLLILDNAEHVSTSVTRLMERLLPACPTLTVLVTSRDSLGLPGEVVFQLSPLDLPPQAGRLSAAAALGYDAVRLLVDRAQALLPGFELDDEEADNAADICRRLDGIALAMAVPRLEVLSLRQLAGRLQDRFGAVSGQRHDVLPRQRTLRAMFDWSWDLLGAPERHLLQLLAISAAGTTLEAIETLAIADGLVEPAARHDVLDHLTRLAQSSLVTVTMPRRGSGADLRYRLLETTRQYALELLPPEGWTALSRLHAQLVAMLFERAEAEWPVTHSATWLNRYEPEADNLRASLQWAFSRPGESALALRLTAASFSLWWELPGLPSVDAPCLARKNVGIARTRGRMLPSVRPRLRQRAAAGLYGSSRTGFLSLQRARGTVAGPGYPSPVSPTVAPYAPSALLRLLGSGWLTPPLPEPCRSRP